MSKPILEIAGLIKNFGGLVTVDNLDLEVKDGEILALLVPSGSGETTTLRMVTGIERPAAGSMIFDGKSFVSVNEGHFLQHNKRLTGVFVNHDQLEALSLADRVAIMRDGWGEQIGPPEEIYDKPVTRFARDFLGRTVIFRSQAVDTPRDGRLAVAGEAGR